MLWWARWVGLGRGEFRFDYWCQVWDVQRDGSGQVREDILAWWRDAVRQEGVCSREVRWYRLGEGLRADDLCTRTLMFEKIAPVASHVLAGAAKGVQSAVNSVSVWCRPVPDVVAQIHSRVTAMGVVDGSGCILKEGIETGKVQGGQDVRDAVVHPGAVGVPMVFAWGPCRRIGEKTGPYVHEVVEGGVIFWFTPVSAGPARIAGWPIPLSRVVGRHSGAEASTVRSVWWRRGVGCDW